MIYGKKLPDLDKIQKKGLLAVKIAQHFALRVDFLDAEVCRHLSKLFRATKAVESESVHDLLSHHVSPDWFDAFYHIEEVPFASASIGQVHRATLMDGSAVIIKVLRGSFKEQFVKDITTLERNLSRILFFLPKLQKVFDPLAILAHIKEYTLAELDLRNEIQGKETLLYIHEKYKHSYDLSKLHFPHFHHDLCSESVLVADFIEGQTFDELLSAEALSYAQLLQLFNLHGLFLFGAGQFHGDMHPGNVILSPEKELYFVDTGALSRISDTIRRGLFYFFAALAEDDLKQAAQEIHAMSEKSLSSARYQHFEKQFLTLYEDFSEKSVSENSLTRQMMKTIKLGVNCGMAFDRGMFPIIKSLMYLDGMVLRCNPDAHLLKDMRPYMNNFKPILEQV